MFVNFYQEIRHLVGIKLKIPMKRDETGNKTLLKTESRKKNGIGQKIKGKTLIVFIVCMIMYNHGN